MKDFGLIMDQVEELLGQIPVHGLRSEVVLWETLVGQGANLPTLRSGRCFATHTRRARLCLDFIDDLERLEKEGRAQSSPR